MSDIEFSIIVPVYREGENIGFFLSRLQRQSCIQASEVIIVDGDGTSTTGVIPNRQYPFRLVNLTSPSGRGLQLRRGALAAAGGIMIFLHVDTFLPVNALELIRTALRRFPVGAFTLRITSDCQVIRAVGIIASFRSRVTRIPYGDQVFFMRRHTYNRVGGFAPIPLMEDVAFMRKLKLRRIPVRILSARIRTSDRRWRREGVFHTTLRNWQISLAYRLGVSPWELAKLYQAVPDGIADSQREGRRRSRK